MKLNPISWFTTQKNAPLVYGVNFELGAGGIGDRGKRMTGHMPEPTKRVPKKNLQLMYLRDDICFNGVNKLTRLTMSNDFYWKCLDEDGVEVKEDVEYMKMWSSNTNLWLKLYEMSKNTFIFGVGWLEPLKIQDGDHEMTVGVDVIDSKTMDFLRNRENSIVYDEYGKPKGYVQYVPYNYDVPKDREKNTMSGKAMFLYPDETAYFTFDNFGGSVDGVGVIEPQYDVVRRKKSLEKANTQSALRRGNPRYHAKIGNEKYRPSPNERKRVKDELMSLAPQDDIVTEWWVDIGMLEADVVADVTGLLKYYVERQASCMGIPMAFLSEGGENTNRATLVDQKKILFRTIEAYRKRISVMFSEQIVPLIMKNRSFSSTPVLTWEPMSLDDKESRSIRLQRYAKSGILTPTIDLENEIRRMEELPPISEEEHGGVDE